MFLWAFGGTVLLACRISISYIPQSEAGKAPPSSLGWIAYEKGPEGGGGIFLIAADAVKPGAPVFLTDGGSDPVWSPDGERIAMRLTHSGWATTDPQAAHTAVPPGYQFPVDDIAVIHRNGTGLFQLTRLQEGDRLWDFAWSPDGKWIALVRTGVDYLTGGVEHSSGRLDILRSDGYGGLKRIADTQLVESHVEWFPDGAFLGYLDPAGWFSIAPVETGEGKSLGAVHADDFERRRFDLSPDGGKLVYARETDSGFFLKTVSLEGWREDAARTESILYSATQKHIDGFAPAIGGLALSPDGKWLLYIQSERGKASLHLLPIEGGEPVMLAELCDCSAQTTDPIPVFDVMCWSNDWRPGWSPDGKWIVYSAVAGGRPYENWNIYIQNAAKAIRGSISPILQVKDGRWPDWQPVG